MIHDISGWRALMQLSTPQLIEAGLRAIRSHVWDRRLRWEHVRAWCARSERIVLTQALALCRAEAPAERAFGAAVLGRLGTVLGPNGESETRNREAHPALDQALPVLIELLRDPDAGVVRAAVFSVSLLLERESLPHLSPLRTHSSPDVRCAVAASLDGTTEAIPIYIYLCHDEDPDVRFSALSEVVHRPYLDSHELREVLARAMHETDDSIRSKALLGLAHRRDSRAIHGLMAEFERDSIEWEIIEAARFVAHPALLPMLRRLLEANTDLSDEDQTQIRLAIDECMGGRKRVPDLVSTYRRAEAASSDRAPESAPKAPAEPHAERDGEPRAEPSPAADELPIGEPKRDR